MRNAALISLLGIFITIYFISCKKSNDIDDNDIQLYPVSINFSNLKTIISPLSQRSKLAITSSGSNSNFDIAALVDDGYYNYELVVLDNTNKIIKREVFTINTYRFSDYKLELPIGDYKSYISVSKPGSVDDADRLMIDVENNNFYDFEGNFTKDVLVGKTNINVKETNNQLSFSLHRPAGFISVNIEDSEKATSSVSGVRLRFMKPKSFSINDFSIISSELIEGFSSKLSFSQSSRNATVYNFSTPYIVNTEAVISDLKLELIKGASNEVIKTFDVPSFSVYRNKITTITGKLFNEESTGSKSVTFSFKIDDPELTQYHVRFN